MEAKKRTILAKVAPEEVFYFCDDEYQELYAKTNEKYHVSLMDGILWSDTSKKEKAVIVVGKLNTKKN